MNASVAQEFYKLREAWQQINGSDTWRIVVWIAQYPDADIIDKFLEIERSPIAAFEDIHFKFETAYQGDDVLFAQQLWQEYLSWFEPAANPEMDMMQALLEAQLITASYAPEKNVAKNMDNLWKELVRFRSFIKDFDAHFCLYFPLVPYNKFSLDDWFNNIVDKVPPELRLVTMDFAQDRRLKKITNHPFCVALHPQLDMLQAIKNEMDKDSGSYDTVDVNARFRAQIRAVMETTTDLVHNRTSAALKKLFVIAKEINTTHTEITALFIAAQAYFNIKEEKKSHEYSEQALEKAELLMLQQDPTGYEIWKGCMLLQAAMHFSKDKAQAIFLYELLIEKALKAKDMYTIMEARRLTGHLYYEMGQLNTAFETMLLSLMAGAYLERQLRRNSTYLHAAHMALFLGAQCRTEKQVTELKEQIKEWIGDDWQDLLQQDGISNAEIKQKNKFLKV